jgi:hypothetical protein
MKWLNVSIVGVVTACATASEPFAEASGTGAVNAPFARYETFAFAPANPPSVGYVVTQRSLEVQRRLAPLVQASLQKRGYQKSEVNPDLLIKITAGSGTIWGEKTQHGNPAEATPSGFIGVDAYDRTTGADVWHGSGYAEIDPTKIDDVLLERGVEKMFDGFPSRRRELAEAK